MNRQERLTEIITNALQPIYLDIENESGHHHVPEGSETHFKLTIVTEVFQELDRLERHRKINQLIKSEFQTGLHALSLHLFSPSEWQNKQNQTMPKSPPCRGGYLE